MRAHAFFARTEWRLLAQRRLPAPWRPDTELVYAKDWIVVRASVEGRLRAPAAAIVA